MLIIGLSCASKGLTCVESTAACTGTVKEGLFCEASGVCCEPPFEQGGKSYEPSLTVTLLFMKITLCRTGELYYINYYAYFYIEKCGVFYKETP